MIDRRHWPELLRLAWPVSTTMLIRVTMRTVDILVVGWVVGAAGVAALGIGDAAARIVLMTALGLGAGTIATVSQHIGAGRRRDADIAATQTALLALALGVPFAFLGWFGARPFFELMGANAEVTEIGVTYLRIIIVSAPARTLAIMLTRAYQGTGDTKTPMVIRAIGTGVNIALTVVLVPGLGLLPELGVAGAGIATAVGNTVSAGILVGWLVRGSTALGFSVAGLRAWDVGRGIVRIGWPQVVERNLFAFASIPLNAIVLTFGTEANAGYQVGRRVMLYALLPARGIGTAASTEVGKAVGRLTPDEGDERARSAMSLAVAISLPVSVLLFVFAHPIAGIFLREPAALEIAADWVRAYAVATGIRAVYGVLRGALQGAGQTRAPMITGAIGILGFAVGFSWFVGVVLGVGLVGVFAGIVLDGAVRTGLLGWVFRRGRWLERARREAVVGSDPVDTHEHATTG